ncbi:MAG: hypothetical protein HY706_12115 [Candidatus Hydrogenedentes bacterium]|nr:hypothetical protein [Candidatus Hydrogenedentota bacterium]
MSPQASLNATLSLRNRERLLSAVPLVLLLAVAVAFAAGFIWIPLESGQESATGTATSASRTDDAVPAALYGESLLQNAVYLYLRLAGIAWIVVEWTAAIILWRAYRMLKRAIRQLASV